MSLANYGVLVGRVVDRRREGGKDSPHYQIHIRADDVDFRVAVNVLSALPPSELLYVADENFHHPILSGLGSLTEGFTLLPSKSGDLALDFIRGNLLDRQAMRPLPPDVDGPDNDLADKIDHYVLRAIDDGEARVFAFGQRWGPESKADKIFGFSPGNGVHDIHMNQGNSGRFVRDNGVWQDGALLVHFPGDGQWVAIFLAFQSQAWHTDDLTGHAIVPVPPTGPGPQPGPGEPDHLLRIVGALVNAVGPAPEAETVTVLNTGVDPVDLAGWSIADGHKQRFPIGGGILPAGETLRIRLAPPVALGNRGGLITLLDTRGLKVHGVAYTAADAAEEGRTIVF